MILDNGSSFGFPLDLRINAPEGVRKLSVFGPLDYFIIAFSVLGSNGHAEWAKGLWLKPCQAAGCSRAASFVSCDNLAVDDGEQPVGRLWCYACAKSYGRNHGIWPGDKTLTLGFVPETGFFEGLASEQKRAAA